MGRRVAFVINQFGGIGSGGSDRVVCVLANEFAARGWDVDILALTDDDSIERKLAPEISVRFEPHVRHARGYVKVGTHHALGAHLVRSYVRQHPDAIVVSFIAWVSMCTIVGTRGLRRGPVVLAERTDPASDPASPPSRGRFGDLCYRFADALVFQTPDAAALHAVAHAHRSRDSQPRDLRPALLVGSRQPGRSRRGGTTRGTEEPPDADRRVGSDGRANPDARASFLARERHVRPSRTTSTSWIFVIRSRSRDTHQTCMNRCPRHQCSYCHRILRECLTPS